MGKLTIFVVMVVATVAAQKVVERPREPLINELTPVLVEIRGETHRSGLNEKG